MNFRIQSALAFTSVIIVLVILSLACSEESDEKKKIRENLSVSKAACSKYNKDYMPYMKCWATVTNNSSVRLKDIEFEWSFLSKSGAVLNSENTAVMDFFEPGKSKVISKRDIPDPSIFKDSVKQTVKYEAEIVGFEIAE
jgi:hypothetical protein